MTKFKLDVVFNYDTISNCTPTEEFLNVVEVEHTNGGHLRVIFEDGSEAVLNARSWKNYFKSKHED